MGVRCFGLRDNLVFRTLGSFVLLASLIGWGANGVAERIENLFGELELFDVFCYSLLISKTD